MKGMFTKKDVVNEMIGMGMVPVFNHKDIKVCIEVVRACYESGILIFEYTARGPAAEEVFVELKNYVSIHFPKLMLGVGSVLNSESAGKYIALGADFIVSPILDPAISEVCAKKNILWIPGCATPTEIVYATRLGADIIKVFPGSFLGPNFISSVLAPIPNLKLMPTGGVEPNEKNLEQWFTSGAVCVGMGSQLFSDTLIRNGDYVTLKKNILEVLTLINKIRNHKKEKAR